MISKKLISKMKQDEELEILRKKVLEITGKREDITFVLGKSSYEEWKEQLRQIIKEHEAMQKELLK